MLPLKSQDNRPFLQEKKQKLEFQDGAMVAILDFKIVAMVTILDFGSERF